MSDLLVEKGHDFGQDRLEQEVAVVRPDAPGPMTKTSRGAVGTAAHYPGISWTRSHRRRSMGIAFGILLIAGTVASFVAINVRARKMSARRDDVSWFNDPDMAPTYHRDPGHHGGHHADGSHHDGGSLGGHHG